MTTKEELLRLCDKVLMRQAVADSKGIRMPHDYTDATTLARALKAALQPTDGVVAPREPTREMIDAGLALDGGDDDLIQAYGAIYKAMLSAAPLQAASVHKMPKPYKLASRAVLNRTDGPDSETYYADYGEKVILCSELAQPVEAPVGGALTPRHEELDDLLDQLESAQAGYEMAGAEASKRLDKERSEIRAKIHALQSKPDLVEALRFYADEKNYYLDEIKGVPTKHSTPVLSDKGERARKALTATPPDTQWRDIETAPKDGTAILGYQKVTTEIWLIAPAYFVHGKWFWFEAHNGNSEYEASITHWMSIPPPPNPNQETGGGG